MYKTNVYIHHVAGQGLKCLTYKIPKLWNELPTDLKEQTSLNTFKKEFKLTPINFGVHPNVSPKRVEIETCNLAHRCTMAKSQKRNIKMLNTFISTAVHTYIGSPVCVFVFFSYFEILPNVIQTCFSMICESNYGRMQKHGENQNVVQCIILKNVLLLDTSFVLWCRLQRILTDTQLPIVLAK